MYSVKTLYYVTLLESRDILLVHVLCAERLWALGRLGFTPQPLSYWWSTVYIYPTEKQQLWMVWRPIKSQYITVFVV